MPNYQSKESAEPATWPSGYAFVSGSNLGLVKSNIALLTARHRYDISSKEAALPGRNDAEMGPANSLHASAYYSEYNERFDFDQKSAEEGKITSPK